MANTDAENLEGLKTARDIVLQALTSGDGVNTVKYVLGVGDSRREHEVVATIELYERLNRLVLMNEKQIAANSGGAINHAVFGKHRWSL